MKRLFDLFFAVLLIILLSPILLLLALLIRFKLGSPILFQQVRPGQNAVPFKLYKFRSMLDTRDAEGHLLPDDQRMTKFGQLLRSSSLDELPELLNIIKGEMSFVGPRPLLMEYIPLYSERQARRHETLPGITGWAQVNGRNAVDWDCRLEMDVWYVENRSFLLDFKILLRTLFAVLSRKGISEDGHVTMSKFKGSEE